MDQYNTLPVKTKQMTIKEFKSKFIPEKSKLGFWSYLGNRKLNQIHVHIRMKCSSLNSVLYELNIVNDLSCACGHKLENAEHFFMNCCLYLDHRNSLFMKLINLNFQCTLNCFLYGDSSISKDNNVLCLYLIQDFIDNTG